MCEDEYSKLVERVTNLEMLVTHLERNCQELNEIVAQQIEKFDELLRKTDHLRQQFVQFKADVDDEAEIDP